MKCEKCNANILFSHYFMEAANLFALGGHICPHCGNQYNVKSKALIYYVISVGIGRIGKYIFLMNNISYDYSAIIKILIIRISFIYFCYIVEQLLFWNKHKK